MTKSLTVHFCCIIPTLSPSFGCLCVGQEDNNIGLVFSKAYYNKQVFQVISPYSLPWPCLQNENDCSPISGLHSLNQKKIIVQYNSFLIIFLICNVPSSQSSPVLPQNEFEYFLEEYSNFHILFNFCTTYLPRWPLLGQFEFYINKLRQSLFK